ncbi:MAG: glycosyltransferase family 39 protein [Terracidiphilus sp.]
MSSRIHPPRWPRSWWIWIAVGAAFRLVFIIFPRPGDDDTADYLELGHNLLHHGIYGMTDGSSFDPTLFRLPGYPIFLAIFEQLFAGIWPHTWLNTVYVFQVIVDLAGCILLACFVRRHFGPRGALIALALAMLCPFTAVYDGISMTEPLSIFAVALGIYAADRAIAAELCGLRHILSLIFAGCAAGLAMLLRPDGVVLFFVIACGLFWCILRPPAAAFSAAQPPQFRLRRALTTASLFSFVALLPLVPWTIRNWSTFHVFQPLAARFADPGEVSIAGPRRWLRTWTVEYVSTANVCWNFPGDTIDLADIPSWAYDSPQQRAETIALINEYNQTTTLTPHLQAAFTALADQRIRDNPFRYYVTLPLLRLADMLLRPRTEAFYLDVFWWRWSDHPGQTVISIFLGLIDLFYVAAALWGFIARRVPWPLILGGYVVLRSVIIAMMENPEPRYTLVFFPVFIVAAAAVLSSAAIPRSQPPALSPSPPPHSAVRQSN